jgi:hypothetical protein
MKEEKCPVGRDDNGAGITAIVIVLVVILIVCMIIIYGGAFIGGFYSLKNYITSFKENIIDKNRVPVNA